ncbi:hypothetical protein GGH19_003641 [Coemansia sp. RSA 1807]|nr:hypothetical protein GGH19_003641 [Coemansia sp. RSA 1807]
MDDYYARAQRASTALRVRHEARHPDHTHLTAASQAVESYGSTNSSESSRQRLLESERMGAGDETRAYEQAREVSDDSNPVSAYFEILTIRRLLLEHVDVVLSPGQIHSPDVQLNLISPLWQATRERCGVWKRGDMRHSRGLDAILEDAARQDNHETSKGNGGPLASAAMLYAALANRDYFLILASAGQSQAELHESRAEVAESLSIMCVKALHKLGNSALIDALCVKFTPIDTDGLHAEIARVLLPEDEAQSESSPLVHVRGDRHMSLLSADQRVRVYRLGRASDVAVESGTASPSRTHTRTMTGQSGWSTPVRDIFRDYLTGGSRIVTEHAIEVAIRSEAKRFTAQRLVGEVVYMLWDGSLHWKGFHCISLPAQKAATQDQLNWPTPPTLNSRASMTFAFERRTSIGSILSTSESDTDFLGLPVSQNNSSYLRTPKSRLEQWLAKALAPLRIPMFENILTMIHAFFFLTLYTAVSLQRQDSMSVEEVVLHVCALAYIADEIRQCMENGLAVYLKSVWNVLDVTIYSVFAAFFCLRLRSLYTGAPEDLDKAYDVLALNASMLWPRLFAVLDQFEFCGTIIIQVRRIIAGTSLFFALLIVMTAGFFQTFYSLSMRHNELDAKNIWGLMTRIFFGSALLGWDQADLFGPYVGYLVMTMYIGVSMLILYNILIGVINQCMVEIEQNAAQEFRFAYTMRVAEYVSARQTYPCVPPLNLLQVAVFWPVRKTMSLSPKSFTLFRSLLLLIAYAPHLLMYAVYKQCSKWWHNRSGMNRHALRSECNLAEKELALIKIRKDDIDEFAFSGTTDGASSEDEPIVDTSSKRTSKAGLSLRMLGVSPTITVGSDGDYSSNAATGSRWTALMETWKLRRQQPKPPQSPRWSTSDVHTCANDEQTKLKLAKLESQMSDIDKKLNTIARLLQPSTNRE